MSYTYNELVAGVNKIEFVNSGTNSGLVDVMATLPDPFSPGNTLSNHNNGTISISAGSTSAYKVGTKISGATIGSRYLKPNASNPMVAYIIDEVGSKPKGNKKNNVIVSIVSAPDGTSISGNTFVKGNSIYYEGEELRLSTDFNGEAVFFLQTSNLPGDVKLKVMSDRADNNIDNGIQNPVYSYSFYTITDTQDTNKISFGSNSYRYQLIAGKEYTDEKAILIPVMGDFLTSCSVVNGQLPAGVIFTSYSSNACVLFGKPEFVGTYESTIQVTSSRSGEYSQARLTIDIVGEDDFSIMPSSNLGVAILDEYFSVEIKTSDAEGGSGSSDLFDPAYVKLVGGELPEGLSLTANIISGKPTKVGNYTFTLEVKDEKSNRIKQKEYYIRVIDGAIVLVDDSVNGGSSSVTLPAGEVDKIYSPHAISAEGFNDYDPVPPFTWSLVSGSLPAGLSIDLTTSSSSVVLTGTPTTEGIYIFVLSVVDKNGVKGMQTYRLKILPKFDPCTVSPKPAGCP